MSENVRGLITDQVMSGCLRGSVLWLTVGLDTKESFGRYCKAPVVD